MYMKKSDLPDFDYSEEIGYLSEIKSGYKRAEVITESNHQALTNPIWV